MKTYYLISVKDETMVRRGQLVILTNGIRVIVENRGGRGPCVEWFVTELLTGLGVTIKRENKTKLRLCLSELDERQDAIYNAVRGVFASDYVRLLSPIMLRRGWEDEDLKDICFYAKADYSRNFLSEYKWLCDNALKWAKDFGKGEQE